MNKYCLIGKKLGHSFSPIIHKLSFKKNNIEATYELVELEEKELPDFIDKLRSGEYSGCNVTIPYKVLIMPYLDFIDKDCKEIGACNTIKVVDGKLYGYNTDFIGFQRQLVYQGVDVKNKDVVILGNGGASKAVQYALKKVGANYKVISSRGPIYYDYLDKVSRVDVMINTTPLGMWPDVSSCVVEKEIAFKADTLVDVIFNPLQTKFLAYKNSFNNGLPMLIFQAISSEEIWLDKALNYELEEIKKAIINE